MIERNLYKCDNCSMEIRLLDPVMRPCPRCGGQFVKIAPFDLNISDERERNIDAIVAEVFPELLEQLENMLAIAAEKG